MLRIIAIGVMLAATPALAINNNHTCKPECYYSGVVYLKGKPSTWPAWAHFQACVKPWSENPMTH